MTSKKRLITIVASAVIALALIIAVAHLFTVFRQYGVMGSFVSAQASQIGPLGRQNRTTVICKTADGSAGHCRALQYSVTSTQCLAIARDLIGSAHCMSGKDVIYKGHTLHITTGEMYPQTGTSFTVEYIR